MTDETDTTTLAPSEDLKTLIRALKGRARILASAAKVRLGEAQAVASHARQRMKMADGSRTRANLVYAFGAVVERGGYLDLDDFAVAGLERHGPLYAYWLAQAANESLASDRAGLLRYIFSDPIRLDWCRQEGARLAWEYAKAARDEETALFLRRQEKGSRHWRKEAMTARQFYMMTLISVRAGISVPLGLNCGQAYDWIALNGGHPDFWTAPLRPPPWRDAQLKNHHQP